MIHKGPWYNPRRDVAPVDQCGVVDLAKAFAENTVPSGLGTQELVEEPCEDTDCMYPKAEDVFDRMQQGYSLRKALDSKSKSTEQTQ